VVNERDKLLGRFISEHHTQLKALQAQGKVTGESNARDVGDLFLLDMQKGNLTGEEVST
jgi:hypothetical protein